MEASKKTMEIIETRLKAFNLIEGPRVGDYLKLPYGLYTRFTEKHDNKIQTGGNSSGSYYLSNSGLSYSGSLDSGIKLNEIRQTNDFMQGSIWVFHNDHAAAGNGYNSSAKFRVFEPIEGADLSGIPDIREYEKRKYLQSLPTVTRINGNGQPYTLPLPKCVILNKYPVPQSFFEELKQLGLNFIYDSYNYAYMQPETHEQFNTILLYKNWSTEFHNNGTTENTLFLRLNY